MRIERDRGGHEVWLLREARSRGCDGCSSNGAGTGPGCFRALGSSAGADESSRDSSSSSTATAAGVLETRDPPSFIGGATVNEYKDKSWPSVIVRTYGFEYATALNNPLLDAGCL